MIPIRNRKKTLQVTVEEMRNFAFAYVEKYAPSKQQLKTYLLKKYMKLSSSDVRKNDVNKLIDIVLSDLEKNKLIAMKCVQKIIIYKLSSNSLESSFNPRYREKLLSNS